MAESHGSDSGTPAELRTDRPHLAQVYDYLLGGKDNFAADREAAQRGPQAGPLSAPKRATSQPIGARPYAQAMQQRANGRAASRSSPIGCPHRSQMP